MDTDETTEPIGSEQVMEVLLGIVAEHPEGYTYQQRYVELGGTRPVDDRVPCRYLVNGQPGCIVGVAFDRLGIPLDAEWDKRLGLSAYMVIDDRLPGQFTDAARYLLDLAQAEQDSGATWAVAVERAHSALSGPD